MRIMTICFHKNKKRQQVTARLYAIRGIMVNQTFCPAQTAVLADRKEVRNPLLHIAANRCRQCIKNKAT